MFSLYKEGLRRTLFLAVLFFAVLLLGAIFLPVTTIQNQSRAIANGWSSGQVFITGLNINPFLIFAMVAGAPILTLYQFAFLNKRSSSDFYHSIPHKRQTLYGAYLAASLTWILGGILVAVLIPTAIYSVFSQYVLVNTTTVVSSTLGILAGSLVVSAAILIAMAITGTIFSNVITAGLILFLPRTVLTAFTLLVSEGVGGIVPQESFSVLGNFSNQIPFGIFVGGAEGMMLDEILHQGAAYTFILALVYFVVAGILFHRRKSEAAEHPAQSKLVHGAIRTLGAFLITIPAIALIVVQTNRSYLGGIIVIYAVAVLAYFAYEIITKRRLTGLLKTVPGLGVLAVLNVAFIVGVLFTQSAILNRTITVDQVAHVQIVTLNQWGNRQTQESYATLRTREIEVVDEVITQRLIDALAIHTAAIQSGQQPWRVVAGGQTSVVRFTTTSGRTIHRNILLSGGDRHEITHQLQTHADYAAALLQLPENPGVIISNDLPQDALREVYDILREEVAQFNFVTWHNLYVLGFHPDQNLRHFGHLNVSGFYGQHTFHSHYPITSATPRAAERFVHHTNQENSAIFQELLDQLHKDTQGWTWIQLFGVGYDEEINQTLNATDEALIAKIQAALASNTPFDITKPFFQLDTSSFVDSLDRHFFGTVFFQLDDLSIFNQE